MAGTILVTHPIESLYPHICKHSELSRLIFEPLTENPTQFCNQIKRLTTSDSAKRAARYLVDPAERIQEALGIVDRALPYTQEELSVCLNLHRAAGPKVLAGFAKRGLVRFGYRKIPFADPDRLRDALQ